MAETTGGFGSELRRFVEEMGLNFEAQGLPRIPSRVISYLVVCEPAEQTADQLVAALQVSRASISTALQLLTPSGLVTRATRPGNRRTYYRLDSGTWGLLLLRRAQLASATREIADRGLEALGDAPPQRRARLEGLRHFYAFFEKELPALVEHWQAQRVEEQP